MKSNSRVRLGILLNDVVTSKTVTSVLKSQIKNVYQQRNLSFSSMQCITAETA